MPEVIRLTRDWHIGDQLDSGGFGRVFLAWSEDRERAVVKIIPKDPGAERELLFEDLNGVPNVVPVLDSGEWDTNWVLVMPKAEKSLRDYVESESDPLSVNNAVEVLIDIANALVAIEGRIVHRDLKPENILLLNGHWCLADFGISRYAEATTAQDTRKYAMTPPYAAPEQWRWERATSATDVYATGVLAFELLAGQLPFQGPDHSDYRDQHLEMDPESIPNIPVKLQSIVSECLYKAPEARPRPQNFLVRLKNSLEPASSAGSRLQRANQRVVEQKAEATRKESVARSEGERRERLHQAADRSLEPVANMLHDQVVANAPMSDPEFGPLVWKCTLNGAEFRMDLAKRAELPPEGARFSSPFDIVAFARITLRVPQDFYGYEGRSHSLWYCDAQDEEAFRWYETAFMNHSLSHGRAKTNPFALDPGEEAFGALSNIMTAYQVAWPFDTFDQGGEQEFIERWIGWFADAAEGNLRHPHQIPERDPHGSWRRS